MAHSSWRKLAEDDLWVQSEFSEDSYSIWVTDLCQVWSEELAGDDLRWRANKDRIPMDVDDVQNLSALLKHLSAAIDKGFLQPIRKGRFFDLSVNVHLPKLSTCAWTFKLEEQDGEQFRTSVTKPLLARVETFGQREHELVGCIRDKDHAIDRLLDVLEKHSIDLADVFPSLAAHSSASRRAISREDAEKLIPSLQAFDLRPSSMSSSKMISINGGQSQNAFTMRTEIRPDNDEEMFDATNARVHPPTKETHESMQLPSRTESESDNSRISKSIKRTIGVRPAPSIDSKPIGIHIPSSPDSDARKERIDDAKLATGDADDASTATESPVHSPIAPTKPTPQAQPKGIKRTLGQRRKSPEVREHSAEEHKQLSSKTGSNNLLIDEDDLANQRREDLKRKLASAAAHKPKKRKF